MTKYQDDDEEDGDENSNPLISGIHKRDELYIEVVGQGHSLDEMIRGFECALRGAGFKFKGHLELIVGE